MLRQKWKVKVKHVSVTFHITDPTLSPSPPETLHRRIVDHQTLPVVRSLFSVQTIPVLVRVLWHPTICEITITLSFSTSFVNGLPPTYASLLSISVYGYTRSRYHMIWFPLPHVHFTSPYARFTLPCVFLYLIFLLPCARCHLTNHYVSALLI